MSSRTAPCFASGCPKATRACARLQCSARARSASPINLPRHASARAPRRCGPLRTRLRAQEAALTSCSGGCGPGPGGPALFRSHGPGRAGGCPLARARPRSAPVEIRPMHWQQLLENSTRWAAPEAAGPGGLRTSACPCGASSKPKTGRCLSTSTPGVRGRRRERRGARGTRRDLSQSARGSDLHRDIIFASDACLSVFGLQGSSFSHRDTTPSAAPGPGAGQHRAT